MEISTCIPMEYDMKKFCVNLFDKNGELKKRYICLGYMITFPLIKSLEQPIPTEQPIPFYKKLVVNSSSNYLGYLVYDIIYPPSNNNTGIINVYNNILEFNNFNYNYDITLNIKNIGNNYDNTKIRFTYFNIYDLNVSSNMNDIYGNETVYDVSNDGQINFTVTGEYQYFFIYYPFENFDIKMTVKISDKKTPIYVCQINDNIKNCKKCMMKKCTCFEIDNMGFIKIKNNDCIKDVPVYVNIVVNDSIIKYLYPYFGYLRDLFINTTIANSLPLPFVTNENLLSKNSLLASINPYEGWSTILTCTVQIAGSIAGKEFSALCVDNIRVIGDQQLVTVPDNTYSGNSRRWHIFNSFSTEKRDQNSNLIMQNSGNLIYTYSWENTPFVNADSFSRFELQYEWYKTWYVDSATVFPPGGIFKKGQFNYYRDQQSIYFRTTGGGAVGTGNIPLFVPNIKLTVTVRPK